MDKQSVLIIDDDPSIRRSLSDILKLKGFATAAAENGELGLQLLRTQGASVVLVDLGLPDIQGLEVLTKIKERSPFTAVIVLTGHAAIESAVEATNRGAFSYLVKPYDVEQLLNNIRRALEKRHSELEIARHQSELERMNAELLTLHEISRTLSQTLELDELVNEVLQVLARARIFPFELRAAMYLLEAGRMRLASFVSLSESSLRPCREVSPEQCICGRSLATGEVIITDDTGELDTLGDCHPPIEGYSRIIVPLKAVTTVVGLLSLYTEPGTEVSESLIRFLNSVGSQIGIAINNARLYQEARAVSLHDPLTGIPNRRFLDLQLAKSFDAARRYGQELTVIMIDIDRFKRYNDMFGHQEGDRLLARVAQILLAEMRNSDYVFRYGGEEFLALLPETGLPFAIEAAKRLRSAVQKETGVTISLGVAPLHPSMPDKEVLLRSADAALYRAKEKGRNRVEVADVQESAGETQGR